MDIARELGIGTGIKHDRKCTQDFVPIKDIRNGIVITEDDRYVKIMEISPSNIEMMSPENRESALRAYGGFIYSSACPKQFQIKCTTRRPQTQEYLRALRQAKTKEKTENICRSIDEYERFLTVEGQFETVDRQFHLIFDFEPENTLFGKLSEEEIFDALRRKSAAIEVDLNGAGNKVIHYADPDYEIGEFIYNHYNRRSHLTHPFSERVQRIIGDTMKVNGLESIDELPAADIRDLLAPRSIDTKTSPNYMMIDGMYRSHYYIDGKGFPSEINVFGWLSRLIRLGIGFDVDIYFTKLNAGEIVSSIGVKQKFTAGKQEERHQYANDSEKIQQNLKGLEYIRYRLKECGEDLFDMSVMVTVYAYSQKELFLKEKAFMEAVEKMGLNMKHGKRLQEDLFFATSPLNILPPQIYNLTRHNITTSGVVAAYPFTTFSLADKDGIMMGRHAGNQNMMFYDQFDRKYSNSNIGIYGASGKGKTFTLLSLTERLRLLGKQVFILAPIKQHEFLRTVEAVDGLFVDMAPKSKERINPFEIWELDSPNEKLLSGDIYINPCYLEDKIENLMIWFTYIIRDIRQVEEAKFRSACALLYKNFGINEDNESIYLDKKLKKKKRMPIFSDFISALEEVFSMDEYSISRERKAEIIAILKDAAEYFDGQTNIDISNKFIVFGLERVPKRWQAAVMGLTTQFIWDIARADRTKEKVIAMDEGWKLLDQKLMADFVVEIFKVIRGYGGGAIFSTQSVSDTFKASVDAGNAILACCNSNIVLGMEAKEATMLSSELYLTPEEIAFISTLKTGMALLIAGPNHVTMNVEASAYEKALFTTNRQDLARIAKQRREEQQHG